MQPNIALMQPNMALMQPNTPARISAKSYCNRTATEHRLMQPNIATEHLALMQPNNPLMQPNIANATEHCSLMQPNNQILLRTLLAQ